MNEDITKILEAGNYAPSGENCQPWKFKLQNDVIEIHLLPERDQSLYSYGNRASYVANGAVIENMIVASHALGYEAAVSMFPEKHNDLFVARIIFSKSSGSKREEQLFSSISKRVTNRKTYSDELIPSKIID